MKWRHLFGALGLFALTICSDPAGPRIPEPEDEEEEPEEPDPSPGVTATSAAFPDIELFFV